MRKTLLPLLLAAAVVFAASGCALPAASKTESHQIVFPASQEGRTQFNAATYDIEPFTVVFELPKGWTLSEEDVPDNGMYPLFGGPVESVVNICNAEGARVGYIGYNLCEIYEGEEDNPQALYSQLTVSNHYFFLVQNASFPDDWPKYVPVADNERFACAMAPVVYSPPASAQEAERFNKGILAREKTRQVYIAMEFAAQALTDAQYIAIAKSVLILPGLQE